MASRFQEKNFPKIVIKDAINRASSLTQDDCLQKRIKNESMKDRAYHMNFITTYNQSHNNIRGIFTKFCPILLNDPHLKSILPKKNELDFS